MLAAGSVAPLAIDPFRQAFRKYRFSSRNPAFGRNFRNAVVTEHATVGDGARKAGMIGTVVAGIHRPRPDLRSQSPALLRVPCQRQLHQRIAHGATQERSSVIAGSENEVNLFLDAICLFAV